MTRPHVGTQVDSASIEWSLHQYRYQHCCCVRPVQAFHYCVFRSYRNRYRAGALIDLAMEFSGARNVGALPTEHGNRERFVRLERFLKNLILDKPKHNPPGNWGSAKKISGLVDAAGFQTFDKDGRIMTVQVICPVNTCNSCLIVWSAGLLQGNLWLPRPVSSVLWCPCWPESHFPC